MWPIGRKSDELLVQGKSVLPIDVWEAVETVDACAMGLFQVIRTGPEADALRLRVGYAPEWSAQLDAVGDGVRAAVLSATGLEPDVELVPNETLLRLGPPHKIPRVARR
jgi:phenylacetate-CoA ligase